MSRSLNKQFHQLCLIQHKDRYIHKKMRQQRTKDDTIGSQQESAVESISAYDSRIASH